MLVFPILVLVLVVIVAYYAIAPQRELPILNEQDCERNARPLSQVTRLDGE